MSIVKLLLKAWAEYNGHTLKWIEEKEIIGYYDAIPIIKSVEVIK